MAKKDVSTKFSFKQLKNERLCVPFKWQDVVLFNLYDISQKDYNIIMDTYEDKQYPLTVNEKGETVIDLENEAIKAENARIEQYRTVALLKAMTRGEVEFADDMDECVRDLEECGIAIFVELQEAISEVFRFKK